MTVPRCVTDPAERPKPAAWFQVHDGRTGRFLGIFLDLPDARRWLLRRPPSERYRLDLHFNSRVVARWRCRSMFGGQVKGIGDYTGGGHGEKS